MMMEALGNMEEGIRVGGEMIKKWLPIRKQDYRALWTA